MSSNPDPSPPATASSRSWIWVWLLIALAWIGAVRVPLVLNAWTHLDSDLAVDGLALIDALNGHWRWHYPATPFIGSPPVLLSYVQARVWGPTPPALVSGGVVAYGLVVAATFLLNRRAFGPSVAAWGLVPLAFASTGTIWLSGRVTGGHLLAVAWHAGAFALLWDALVKGGWWRAGMLGLWCGFGLYVDSMFAVTWVGLGVAVCASACLAPGLSPGRRGEEAGKTSPSSSKSGRIVRVLACLLAFGLASGVGVAPRVIGARVDPHDAYVGQFRPVTRGEVVVGNAKILVLDCLPRLIAGHRLPRLQAEPDPSRLPGGSPSSPEKGIPWLGIWVTVVSLGLFAWAMAALVVVDPKAVGRAKPLAPALFRGEREAEVGFSRATSARRAIRWGLIASTLAVAAGFLVYPSITSSENYRYLVFWLVPWSSGFGLMMARVASKGLGGALSAGTLALGFAALMTVDSARWYARLGWVDSACLPVQKSIGDPVWDWLDDHLRITAILGDYWDVYRISFLTGGRVRAVPFPVYPDRFPEIKRGLPRGRDRVVIVRPREFGPEFRDRALALGARQVGQGKGFSVVEWPEGMTP